jgi:hypothetical protein
MSTRRVPGATARAVPMAAARAVLVAGLVAALAGCANGAGDTRDAHASGGSLPTSSTSGDPSGTAVPTGSSGPGRPSPTRLPPVPVTPPPSPAGDLTLTGSVVEGVESNCLLLESPGGAYLLLTEPGVDRSLIRPGARITVRGRIDEGIMTTCQQGIPFMVAEVGPG